MYLPLITMTNLAHFSLYDSVFVFCLFVSLLLILLLILFFYLFLSSSHPFNMFWIPFFNLFFPSIIFIFHFSCLLFSFLPTISNCLCWSDNRPIGQHQWANIFNGVPTRVSTETQWNACGTAVLTHQWQKQVYLHWFLVSRGDTNN